VLRERPLERRGLFCETGRVMRHRHHPETVAERIDALMGAVFNDDEEDRMRCLSENLAPGFVYISPSAVVDGPEGLSDTFSHFRHDGWRQTSLQRTSDVDIHHAHFRYSWERREGSTMTMEGWSFGWLDADGKIVTIVSFDGLVPGQYS
jgi:hypothetical protein